MFFKGTPLRIARDIDPGRVTLYHRWYSTTCHTVCVSDGIPYPMGQVLYGESATFLSTTINDKELV